MSYLRPMGDGPITRPSQVDPTVYTTDENVVGVVTPKRVECSALPDDSPWKRPGQVCAPGKDMFDYISEIPWQTSDDGVSPLLLVAGAAAAAYYLLRKPKR